MGERAALGAAGRARGVDEGGERVGAEHATAYGYFRVRDVLAQLGQPLHVPLLEDPHVPQVGDAVAFRAERGRLRHRLRGEGDGSRVLEDPADLEDGGGGVDGDGDQTRRPGREVQQRPLVRRPCHDRDAVAGGQALGDQALRHRQHLRGELGGGHILPVTVGVLPAEDRLARGHCRVVERDVRERAVGHLTDEGRHGHLSHDSVQPPDLGLHEGGWGVVRAGLAGHGAAPWLPGPGRYEAGWGRYVSYGPETWGVHPSFVRGRGDRIVRGRSVGFVRVWGGRSASYPG